MGDLVTFDILHNLASSTNEKQLGIYVINFSLDGGQGHP